MARNAKLLFFLLGCSDLFGAHGLRNEAPPPGNVPTLKSDVGNDGGQNERILVDMMMPGDRVSSIDRSTAICAADTSSQQGVEIEKTVIDYYYAIESTEEITTSDSAGRSIIRGLEDKLFRSIRPAVLWCYFDTSQGERRNLLRVKDDFRKLTLEEAGRQLSIVTVSTSPEDETTNSKKIQ
eukprot:jgi/Psemu1/24257/gm1.24257_g